MKKVLSLILCGVLLLSLAGCNEPKVLSGSVRDRLPKRVDNTVVLADQSVHKLTYLESRTLGGKNFNRYTDENDCIFDFDDQGILLAYENSYYGHTDDPSEKITKERAVEIATQHIKSVYGEVLEGYTAMPADDTSTYYAVDFFTYHGAEGKMRGGDSLVVSVAYDGTVNNSLASWYGSIEGFDEKLIEGITFESLEPFVEKEAQAAYPETYVDSQVRSVIIKKNNGKFELSIGAGITTCINSKEYNNVKTFSYPLG